MFDNNTTLYKLRKYLFGNKYTNKEKFIMSFAFILMSAGYGIAMPIIIQLMDVTNPSNATDKEIFIFSIYMLLYVMVGYMVFFYFVNFVVEFIICIYSFIKFKLTGKCH